MSGRTSMPDGENRLPHGVLAVVALSLAALFWSGNFIAGRALRDDIDPVMLNTLRWLLCLALFLPLVGGRAIRNRHVVLRDWRLLLVLGATGIAAFQTMVYMALSQTTAANAVLMLALTPAVILIGGALSGGVRPTVIQGIGTAISLIGAADRRGGNRPSRDVSGQSQARPHAGTEAKRRVTSLVLPVSVSLK